MVRNNTRQKKRGKDISGKKYQLHPRPAKPKKKLTQLPNMAQELSSLR